VLFGLALGVTSNYHCRGYCFILTKPQCRGHARNEERGTACWRRALSGDGERRYLMLSGPADVAPSASVPTPTTADAKSQLHSIEPASIVANSLFALLLGANIIRTLRHAMWRDELQAFMLALYSPSPWSLLLKLKYEGHPGLWHFLLWLITRVTSDPMWMQILHFGLAIGVWTIIYWWSPFNRVEKILLLLSYFLFWEYFVVSRSYVLIALIAFAFIILRERPRQPQFLLWLLLGLLANVQVFGAIWSVALGATLAIERVRCKSLSVGAVAVYVVLFVFAVATMLPAADCGLVHDVRFSPARLNADLSIPFGAFAPLRVDWIRQAVAFLRHPETADIPQFWNPNPAGFFVALTHADITHPLSLSFMFAVPIAACWPITRQPLAVLEFGLLYAGVVLFANIWNFPGSANHHGVVFLGLIAAAWRAQARQTVAVSWAWKAFLILNAFGGVLTLASELRPFSEGYNVATWIEQNGLANAFLIGSRDAQASTIAGYLGQQIYYLECECEGSFIVWNDKRHSLLTPEEFGRRLSEGVALAASRKAILIRYRPLSEQELASSSPDVHLVLLKSFTNASTDENFWIYRVSFVQ
jgi:hypothetical protein